MAVFLLVTPRMVDFENSSAEILAPFHAIATHTNRVARSFGRRAAFHDLQHRIVNRFLPFQVLKGMSVTAGGIDRTLLGGRLKGRFATREELLAATAVAEVAIDMSVRFIDDAIGRGDKCFGIFDGPDLVSFGWYSNQPTPISDKLVLRFDRDWIYMYKGHTLRSHRGKGLHEVGTSLALSTYTKRGYRGLIRYVRSTNFESLRAAERMGYQTFGEIYIAEALGRSLIWSTPGCAAYRFRVERCS
jgi:hypothetical protein